MKRACVSRAWLMPGLLFFVVLLCVSVSQVLASSAKPAAPGDDVVVADVGLESNPIRSFAQVTMTSPYTMYFGYVTKNGFTAFTYQDNFQSTSSGWPWKTGSFDAGYRTDGDGSRVWHYRMTTEDDIGFATGPTYVGGNFDYTAYMRRATLEQPLYWYDEYGLLVSPNPVDLNSPSVNGAYTFHIKLKVGSGDNSSWEVAKWTAPNKSNRTILVSQEDGTRITDAAKVWNIFRIERNGTQLRFLLNREGGGALQQVFTYDDPSIPYVMYIGFYAAHSKTDFGDYPLEAQFDNVVANSAP
jgi:hypothetical protein